MEPRDEVLETIFWRDEILQIMYWLRGEKLGETVSAQTLLPFLEIDEKTVCSHLERMEEEGYLTRVENAQHFFRFTEFGLAEGRRNFAAEFVGLTNQGHGECNNPDCACHTLRPAACEHHLD
jgi:hypothetical protein